MSQPLRLVRITAAQVARVSEDPEQVFELGETLDDDLLADMMPDSMRAELSQLTPMGRMFMSAVPPAAKRSLDRFQAKMRAPRQRSAAEARAAAALQMQATRRWSCDLGYTPEWSEFVGTDLGDAVLGGEELLEEVGLHRPAAVRQLAARLAVLPPLDAERAELAQEVVELFRAAAEAGDGILVHHG
jgi:hypothetical protein